ncbi:MAG: hypothetical protein GY940_09660 [bacterium]|nr:hypothetical protein [bacterium]
MRESLEAEEAEFCFGVIRALDIFNDLYEKKKDIQIGSQTNTTTGLEIPRTRGIAYIHSFSFLLTFPVKRKKIVNTLRSKVEHSNLETFPARINSNTVKEI